MTTPIELIVLQLGKSIANFLLGMLKSRLQSASERQKAKHLVEDIGKKVATEILPLFERALRDGQLNPEPVIRELEITLAERVTADFLVQKDLDYRALSAELRVLRPLPPAHYSKAEEDLYERALELTVRHVVGIASQLPQFEEVSIAQILQRLTWVNRNIEELVAGIRQSRDDSEDKNRSYELNYRLALQSNLDYLELFGIDLYSRLPRQKLAASYVSLSFQLTVGKSSESLPAEALLDRLTLKESKILIRGEVGSGKSTFFRWAAILAAAGVDSTTPQLRERFQGSIDNNLKSVELPTADYWRRRIPFLVRLRDCRTGALPSPEDFPELITREIGAPPPDWVKYVLKEKRGLLLLDGVDEISGARREATRREIEALTRQYPGNYFLVSTRPTAIEEGWLNSIGFREARINPLSEFDRSDFIDRWYGAVTEEPSNLGSPTEGLPGLAESLKEELSANHEIARLATNPLLCAMICALYRDRRQKLPESQRELCEALCQALLHRREREGGVDLSEFPESYRRLEYEQKRAAIQELAYSMVLNADSAVPIEKAREKIGKALRQFRNYSDVSDVIVAEVTGELVVKSGILREESPGLVGFVHNSFKEFLAGDYCADENNAGLLAEKALEPDWQPVVLFAVAGRQRGFATEVIRRILQKDSGAEPVEAKLRPDESPDSRRRANRARQLMALRCQAVALFLDEKLKTDLDSLARDLLPPRSMDDAEALASAGESASQFLLYNGNLSESRAAACVRALRLIGTPRARHALRSYFSDMRLGVISELAQAVNPLELAWVQEQLRALEILPEGISAQIVDLSPLSKLSDLQALSLLGTKVTDLDALGKLKDLEILNLSDTPVSNLLALSQLTVLQKLELAGTRVENLAPLGNLRELEDLNLSHTPVTDLTPLSRLSHLNRLSLVGTPVVDISPLSQLKGLKYLYLAGTKVLDVSPLAQLKRLRHIDLAGTPVADLAPLRGLQELEMLDVTKTLVRDSSILEHLRCQVYD